MQHFERSYILAPSLGTDGRVGAWGLQPPFLNPTTFFCQLGSGLDSNDCVEVMFLERTFRPSEVLVKSSGKGA